MNSTTNKAVCALIPFGQIQVEGLLLINGDFAISVTQANDLLEFSASPQNAKRTVERILGKSFQPLRVKTKLNPNPVAVMSLIQFEELLARLDRSGNVKAQQFRDGLIGLSLRQVFCDAFGIKFDVEERQAFLKVRQSGKYVRRSLTDAIASYIDRHPELSENHRKFAYSNVSDCLNRGVFNKSSKQLCEERKCSPELLRDILEPKELQKIEHREEHAIKLIDKFDMEPLDAMKEAIQFHS